MRNAHEIPNAVDRLASRRSLGFCRRAWLGVLALLLTAQTVAAQSAGSAALEPNRFSDERDVDRRIQQLEEQQRELVEQNRALQAQVNELSGLNLSQDGTEAGSPSALQGAQPGDDSDASSSLPSAGVNSDSALPSALSPTFDTAEDFPFTASLPSASSAPESGRYFTIYDRGFVLRPFDADESPFELKINGQNEVRYTGFIRDRTSYTNSAGTELPIDDMSSFQLPRGRLIFSGFAFRKELLYNLNIDYNTVSNSQINFRAYWMGWRFSDAFALYAGQGKVPGGREWLLSFVDLQGVDRSMATTFFRPSLSQGIWATGTPSEGVFYHVMLSNGFNTLGSTPRQTSSAMASSGSIWWEPLGSFGRGYSDFEWHEEPAIRLGTSLVYAPERGPQGGGNVPENSPIRLSDGTLITLTGALSPGVTINEFKIGLATVDLAWKYRGFSLSGEFYSQSLFGMHSDGTIPMSSIYQFGGFAQSGYFVIPKRLEPYFRTSYVTGPFGAGQEYAGGVNWFLLPEKQNLQFTFDVAWLKNNPADQNRTNLVAGQTGLMIRTQLQWQF